MDLANATYDHLSFSVEAQRVLNVGSGRGRLRFPFFTAPYWREVRLDIDPAVKPDIVGSFANLRTLVGTSSFDAVWSSHSIEHLAKHEVPAALREFHRILRPDGFALVRCPDLEVACRLLIEKGPDSVGYISPSGPVTPIDMLYGHGASIARGHSFMAHRTGFTGERLAGHFLDAGFSTVYTKTEAFDLWALAVREDVDGDRLRARLAEGGLDFCDDAD